MRPLLGVSLVIFTLLLFAALPAAFANSMNGSLAPEHNKGEVEYTAYKNIKLVYPQGSGVYEAFANVSSGNIRLVSDSVAGNLTSDDPAVVDALNAFSRAMLDKQSPALVTGIRLIGAVEVRPSETSTSISYTIKAVTTIEKFVLDESTLEGPSNRIVDLEWRAITIREPIRVELPNIGEVDVSRPIGVFEKLYPEIAAEIENSSAAQIFSDPTMDFQIIDQNMGTWHYLFDPTGSSTQSSDFFEREGVAGPSSVYSLGESSFREGQFGPKEISAEFMFSGAEVSVLSQVPPPSAQVTISGFASLMGNNDPEIAYVSPDSPQEAAPPSDVQIQRTSGDGSLDIAVRPEWTDDPDSDDALWRFDIDFLHPGTTELHEHQDYDVILRKGDEQIFSAAGAINKPLIHNVEGSVAIPQQPIRLSSGDYTLEVHVLGLGFPPIPITPEVASFSISTPPTGESSNQDVPFELTGINTDKSYEAKVLWTPAKMGQGNTFRVSIYDANQPEPKSPVNVNYDIKVYKDGKYLLPASVFEQSDYREATLVFPKEGSYMFTIENIDSTGGKIEMPIQVTPEFPHAGMILLIAVAFSAAVYFRDRLLHTNLT